VVHTQRNRQPFTGPPQTPGLGFKVRRELVDRLTVRTNHWKAPIAVHVGQTPNPSFVDSKMDTEAR
jgi:hypothetical protein